MKINILSILLILCSISGINAINLSKDSISINEVVVTGSKTVRPVDQIPSSISVIHQETIENSGSANILPLLSGYVPGLFITERGIAGFGVAAGSAGAITIRGIGSNAARYGDPLINTQILFLIDGHPQEMGLMGHHLSDSYLSDNIERVEIIRGPASVLYGSNAMGGVINLITKKLHKDGYRGNVNVQYGAYNTQNYSAHAGYNRGRWNGNVFFNHQQSDGMRPNSAFNNNSGSAGLGYKISDNWNISGDFKYSAYKAYDPDTLNAPTSSNKWVDIKRGSGNITLDNHYQHSSGSLILYSNFGEHYLSDGFHSTDRSTGFSLFQSFDFYNGNIIAGTDFMQLGGFAENNNLNAFLQHLMNLPLTKYIYEGSSYAMIRQTLANKFTFDGGLRYSQNSVYGGEWIPQAGLSYQLSPNTLLKGSASKGYRSPSVKELYMFPPRNEALLPERMMNYDLTWKQIWPEQKLSTALTAFLANGSNLIRQVGMQYVNSGTFQNTGLEATAAYHPIDRLDIQASYSYLHMKTPVPAAPAQQFFISAGYQFSKQLKINLNLQNVMDLYLKVQPVEKESFTKIDLRTIYNPLKWLEVNLSVNNLLNQQYMTQWGYPMPPLHVLAGFKILFGRDF